MKTGEYIVERLLPRFVAEAAARQQITCEALSDEWVLRLSKGETVKWVVGYQFDLNTSAASSLAGDKVATHLALKRAGIPSAVHEFVRLDVFGGDSLALWQQRAAGSGPFVVKPIQGTSARGVRLVKNVEEATQYMQTSEETPWAVSPLYDIVAEYRIVMLGGQALVMYEKAQPMIRGGLRLYNLGEGAIATQIVDVDLTDKLNIMAKSSCIQLSLRLASVDIIRLSSGELLVLEVNDGIMMEHYARTSDEHRAVAAKVYDEIVAAVLR